MPNRILFLVSAVLAGLALPVLVLPVIPNVAYAADDCLASPDKATPSGGHWRYHIERGTGRKCWYLADEAVKSDQTKSDAAAADDATPAADNADTTASVPPRPAAKIKPSLERAAAAPPDRPRPPKPAAQPAEAPASNAHAEFLDSPRGAQPVPAAPAQPDASQTTAPQGQGSVATRWPSPVGIVASDGNAAQAAAASVAPAAAPKPAAEPQPVAATDQAAPVPTAVTDQTAARPTAATGGPDYLLYALIIAVTGFTAVVGFAALRFLADWWRDWREERRWRRSVPSYAATRGRSMTAIDEVTMGLAPANDSVTPRSRGRRTVVDEEPPRRLEDEIDEIEQLLALTRQAEDEARSAAWHGEAPRDAAE